MPGTATRDLVVHRSSYSSPRIGRRNRPSAGLPTSSSPGFVALHDRAVVMGVREPPQPVPGPPARDAGDEQRRAAAIEALKKLKIFSKQDNVPLEVVPGVFVGCLAAAKNKEGLTKSRISHIVNASPIVPCYYKEEIEYMALDVHDCATEDLSVHFEPIAAFIDRGRASGGVLVHCYAGVSRSATLVAAYLILRRGMTLQEALDTLRAARPTVQPNPGFLAQLRALEMRAGRAVHPPRRSDGASGDAAGAVPGMPVPAARTPALAADDVPSSCPTQPGPVAESYEEEKRIAIERALEHIRRRGVFVGSAPSTVGRGPLERSMGDSSSSDFSASSSGSREGFAMEGHGMDGLGGSLGRGEAARGSAQPGPWVSGTGWAPAAPVLSLPDMLAGDATFL